MQSIALAVFALMSIQTLKTELYLALIIYALIFIPRLFPSNALTESWI